jgi:hypothetical protein
LWKALKLQNGSQGNAGFQWVSARLEPWKANRHKSRVRGVKGKSSVGVTQICLPRFHSSIKILNRLDLKGSILLD